MGTQTFWAVFTQGLVAGLVGLLVYGLILYILQSPEMHTFVEVIKRKLFKVKPIAAELPDSSTRAD